MTKTQKKPPNIKLKYQLIGLHHLIIRSPDIKTKHNVQSTLVGRRNKAGFIVGKYKRLDFQYLAWGRYWTYQDTYPFSVPRRLADKNGLLKIRIRWTFIDHSKGTEINGPWSETKYTFPGEHNRQTHRY